MSSRPASQGDHKKRFESVVSIAFDRAGRNTGMKSQTTSVLIAGGGPVGLTLAHVLSSFGIPCILAERNATTTRHPKMDLTNARSMEIFKRIGVADALRRAGVPQHHDMLVVYTTSLKETARELHRFTYPSVTRKREIIREINDGSQPAEPPMRISQAALEPTLKNALERIPTAIVRFGCAVEAVEESENGVVSYVRDAESNKLERIESVYVVGCDGAGSVVRKSVDIPLSGETGLRPSYLVHFKSSALDLLQRWGVIWHRRSGNSGVIAQDDKETWTVQFRVAPDGSDLPTDPAVLLRKVFGREIGAEIIVANAWRANLLVADRYRKGRVLLAGDSVHQFIPTGGYGMNTGVGDAMDVGWKLAAVLQGWGGERLLESYEMERRPVALANREASRRHFTTRQGIRELFAKSGDLDEDAAEPRRKELADMIRRIGNKENESFGVEYGYRYDGSPVIVPDDGSPPVVDPVVYRPSTWTGARLPSVILSDGTFLYDLLGPWFSLIAFDDADTGDIAGAAARLGVPVKLVRVAELALASIYERKLLLVRPDHHIAWRGDVPPDWSTVLAWACGRSVPPAGS